VHQLLLLLLLLLSGGAPSSVMRSGSEAGSYVRLIPELAPRRRVQRLEARGLGAAQLLQVAEPIRPSIRCDSLQMISYLSVNINFQVRCAEDAM